MPAPCSLVGFDIWLDETTWSCWPCLGGASQSLSRSRRRSERRWTCSWCVSSDCRTHPELAMGAIASGGVRVMNEDVVIRYRPTAASIEAVTRAERIELERRERAYRNGRPAVSSEGRTVVLIDDGLATGATMRVAVRGVRLLGPARIVVAVPVGSREACEALREVADEVVCALTPEPFSAVGLWYEDFSQTTDDEGRELLSTHGTEGRTRSA